LWSVCEYDTVIALTQETTMPLNSRSEDVNRLAEALAAGKNTNRSEAVTLAPENDLRPPDAVAPLRERLRPLQQKVFARPATGREADKAFYDDLSDEV
jgi:antitoxin VapB